MTKGGKRVGAGRKKQDKTQLQIASMARGHTETALKTLVTLMKSGNESVQLGAVKEILDRGWGKPSQTIAGDPEKPVEFRFSWLPVQK